MYDFVYCFAIDGKVNWSGENAADLLRRAESDSDRQIIEEFAEKAEQGSFITLESGNLIFCTRTSK